MKKFDTLLDKKELENLFVYTISEYSDEEKRELFQAHQEGLVALFQENPFYFLNYIGNKNWNLEECQKIVFDNMSDLLDDIKKYTLGYVMYLFMHFPEISAEQDVKAIIDDNKGVVQQGLNRYGCKFLTELRARYNNSQIQDLIEDLIAEEEEETDEADEA